MPRVGSLSRMMRGSVISHLAITTFCWLPPDRVETASLRAPILICSRAMPRSTAARSLARSTKGPVEMASSDAIARLSAIDIGSINPSVLRSSGTSAMPTAGDLAALDRDAPGDAAQHAEQGKQQRFLALPIEAAEADDLAGADAERNAVEMLLPGQVLECQHRLHRPTRRLCRILGGDVAPDHQLNDIRGRAHALVEGFDMASVAEHRGPVGERLDLVHAV